MRQDVHPITAFLVISIAICLISMIVWARGEALRVGGPDQIQQDPQGNVYLHVSGSLYQFSSRFELLQEIQLEKLGVSDLVGDFAFFSNGDMLVRRGRYEPGVFESILRYMRVSDRHEPVAQHEGDGLYRCRLTSMECTPFGGQSVDFDSAFHLSIDVDSNTVYLSDTGRHKLRKFDAEGRELSVQSKGFKFPNQNMLYQDKLLVADTNHHAIQEVATSDDNFGAIINTRVVRNPELGAKSWTYSFARVDDHWWVNNMGANMKHGAVAVFDEQWQYQYEIQLPAGADPIDFGVFEDRVLVTDLDNVAIYQLDKTGQVLQTPLPKAMDEKLAALIKSRAGYYQLAHTGIALFVLFLVTGLVAAVYQGRSRQEASLQLSPQERAFVPDDPNIQWIDKNKTKVRLFKLALYLPIPIMLAVLAMLLASRESLPADTPYLELGVLCAFFSITPVILKKVLFVDLGVLGDLLVIKKGNEYAAGTGKNIFYSDHHILVGKLFIPLNQQNMIFDTQQVIQKVMPLLQGASYVKPGEMTNMILRRLSLATVLMFIAVFALVLGGVFWFSYQ